LGYELIVGEFAVMKLEPIMVKRADLGSSAKLRE
jgi:hypothetical protein